MSEKEKLQSKDEEIKKFEAEVEDAIDELFVPLSGDGDDEQKAVGNAESEVGVSDLKPVGEEKKRDEGDDKTRAEEKIELPNLESSIEAAIDELFVDTTAQGETEAEPEKSVSAMGDMEEKTKGEEDAGEPPVVQANAEEGVASEEQINAEIVDSLKEKLLSLDWEISAANIRAMEKALNELPPEITSNPKIVSIVRMMQGVLKYLATVRYSASPLSIQFLRDAMEALEKFMVSPVIEDDEGKRIVGELVNKFRRLKYEAKKYQKVKVRRDVAEKRVEERELPSEIIPDVLQHVDQIQKNLEEIATYNKRIKVCINRVQNLLSRYERLQAVLERKPTLAKVSNYFGETTKGMVQEVSGIENYIRELNGIFEQSAETLKQHKEILEKKSVAKGADKTEKPVSPVEYGEEVPVEAVKEDVDESTKQDEVVAEPEVSGEKTLVVPPPVDEKADEVGEMAAEPVPVSTEAEVPAVEEAGDFQEASPEGEQEEEVSAEPGKDEGIPEIDISPQVPVAEEAEQPDEEDVLSAEEPSEEVATEEPPEIPSVEEPEEPEKSEISVTSESSFEPVYLITVAGQVLAIPSRFVANVYSLPERKIGLISSKGYAFLKELKPLFRSIKHGLSGPLAQKPKSELKGLRADVIKLDLKSLNISEENIPERQKGMVLLSNGEQTVLLCTDESVSKRPTPVTNYEGNNMGGCLSGRVEIEGQFNVPVIDVEKLLSQQAN